MSDPASMTLSELQAHLAASAGRLAVIRANAAVVEAALASGAKSYPMARCGECGERLPVRDDGTCECPDHGILHGPDN